MTEGGISAWKKKEGESFNPGDLLLEIVRAFVLMQRQEKIAVVNFFKETDKATIDVEAQDAGVLAKIIASS